MTAINLCGLFLLIAFVKPMNVINEPEQT